MFEVFPVRIVSIVTLQQYFYLYCRQVFIVAIEQPIKDVLQYSIFHVLCPVSGNDYKVE